MTHNEFFAFEILLAIIIAVMISELWSLKLRLERIERKLDMEGDK